MRHILCLLALMVILSTVNLPSAVAEELTFEQIRAGYLENRAKFKSMRISYQIKSRNSDHATRSVFIGENVEEVWTDGRRLQVRIPQTGVRIPARFPDTAITPDALNGVYKQMAIWSLTGESGVVREWHGHKIDGYDGSVTKADPPEKLLGISPPPFSVPPLFTPPASLAMD